jgi:hypothetical protein
MRRHAPFALLLALAAPASLRAQEAEACCDDTVPPESVVKGITGREIGGHMSFLASDLMKGRDTASPEIRLAAEYLATRLLAAGAEPSGDDEGGKKTYFQKFPLEYVTPRAEGTSLDLVVEKDGARREIPLGLNADFYLFPRGVAPGEVEAPVVFAGQGGEEDIKGLDLKNRFVLTFSQPVGPGRRAGRGNPFAVRQAAQEAGALGILTMAPPGTEADPNAAANNGRSFMQQSFGRPMMTLGAAPSSMPFIQLEPAAGDALAAAAGLKADAEPGALDGVRVRFAFAADKEVKHDRNVVGLFPGSDPEKKKEVVIFSAHYDHVGVGSDGQIFNGSDDNSSGTSSLLEIAEAFGDAPRPARSVAFLWVSGEEKGLLGSEWFSEHISLPEGYKIVADLNLDMVSRNDGHQVGITPSDKHPDYSTLIPAAIDFLKGEEVEAKFDADQFYARTDSYNFAQKGIPIIFFFSGIHDDYHQPTDDVDKADFEKAARVARAAFRLGYSVAQASEVPHKIKPGEGKAEEKVGAEASSR